MGDYKRVVLRFSKAQRFVHWLFAISFLVLAFTGLLLMFSRLGPLADIAWLAKGGVSRWIHRIAAIGFAIAPVIYFFADREGLKALVKESFTYDKDDAAWAHPKNLIRYFTGRAVGMPPSGRLNAGEKFHHAIIILAYFALVGTGILLLIGQGKFSTTTFSIVVMLHDIAMVGGMALTAGHIYFTFVYGALINMTRGYMPEYAAKLEHLKWYEEVKDTNLKILD